MGKSITNLPSASTNFDVENLDLMSLVGQPVTIFSKQFPGKPIQSQVVSAGVNRIRLVSDGHENILVNLVTSQMVIVQLLYRGELLSINARLQKTDGGQCNFIFEGSVVPLSQRKFVRVTRSCPVTMAAFSHQTITQRPLNKLPWFRTDTLNFSSGGALVRVPGFLENDLYVLMNIDVDYEDFPIMVLAQVRYCFSDKNSRPLAGLEFVVRELAEKKYTRTILKRLPEPVLSYTAPVREKLNRIIQADLVK